MGMEIIEQAAHSCTIKCMVKENIHDFDPFLRKIFSLVDSAYSVLCNYNEEDLTLIHHKHDAITRFISYCERLLNKFGYIDHMKTSYYKVLLSSLEMMIDVMEDLANKIMKENRSISSDAIPILEKIHALYKEFISLYYSYDIKKLDSYDKMRIDIVTTTFRLSSKLTRDDLIMIGEVQVIPSILQRSLISIGMALGG